MKNVPLLLVGAGAGGGAGGGAAGAAGAGADGGAHRASAVSLLMFGGVWGGVRMHAADVYIIVLVLLIVTMYC